MKQRRDPGVIFHHFFLKILACTVCMVMSSRWCSFHKSLILLKELFLHVIQSSPHLNIYGLRLSVGYGYLRYQPRSVDESFDMGL